MSKTSSKTKLNLLRSYPKNIFCLEALWNRNIENKLTVLPILELVAKTRGIKFIYLTSNTLSEFEFNLKLLSRKRTYQILYFAFHGDSDLIELGDSAISLKELEGMLAGRFKDLVVHFGSCGTMNVDLGKLNEFTKNAGVRMVSGYTKEVDWIESSAMDMLYFSKLQDYRSISHLDAFLRKTYPDLVEHTGFTTFRI